MTPRTRKRTAASHGDGATPKAKLPRLVPLDQQPSFLHTDADEQQLQQQLHASPQTPSAARLSSGYGGVELQPLPNQCDTCGKIFTDAANLSRHRKLSNPCNKAAELSQPETPPHAPKCEHCGKQFPYSFSARHHYRYCNGGTGMSPGDERAEPQSPVHQCATCDQTFADAVSLSDHTKHSHSSENPTRSQNPPNPPGYLNSPPKARSAVPSSSPKKRAKSHLPTYQCNICGQTFDYARSVRIHIENLHSPDNTTPSLTRLKPGEHRNTPPISQPAMPSSNGNKLAEAVAAPYQCSTCGQKFARWKGLQSHTKNPKSCGKTPTPSQPAEPSPFQCKQCGEGFESSDDLAHHEAWPAGAAYMCKTCGSKFTNGRALGAHIQHTECSGIRQSMYQCEHCPNMYKSLFCLNYHRKHCTADVAKTELPPADERVKTESESESSSEPDSPFACAQCGEHFSTAEDLARHSTWPSGAPFVCKTCGGDYENKRALASHLKTSNCTNVLQTAYQCQNCGTEYANPFCLVHHRQSCDADTTSPRYECGGCGEKYPTTKALRQHHERAAKCFGTRYHKCERCGKMFRDLICFAKHTEGCAKKASVPRGGLRGGGSGATRMDVLGEAGGNVIDMEGDDDDEDDEDDEGEEVEKEKEDDEPWMEIWEPSQASSKAG